MSRLRTLLLSIVIFGAFDEHFIAATSDAQPAATILGALRDSVSNWGAATAAAPGQPWLDGTNPCGGSPSSSNSSNSSSSGGSNSSSGGSWKGVTCSPEGAVIELDLAGLGLAGTLPPQLAQLTSLQLLDLRGNAFQGTVPQEWWEIGAFGQPQTSVELRPGSPAVCGPVVPLDPQLYAAVMPAQALSRANTLRTGNRTSSLQVVQTDLLAPGTRVTLTNWLGGCMRPCSEVEGGLTTPPAGVVWEGLTWPPMVMTNVFDLSWVFNMSMPDLVVLNPNASSLRTGASVAVPCYPADQLRSGYYGSDVAFGQFAGSNQVPGPEGLAGAVSAAQVVGTPPNQAAPPGVLAYTSPLLPAGGGGGEQGQQGQQQQPVYWFVDLLTPYQVSAVMITAGGSSALTNASLFIGSNATSVFANTLVAANLSLAAGQQLAVPAKGASGRYAIVYTGTPSEGRMSLGRVHVYAYESNAATNKPVSVSALSSISRGGTGASLQALVDNNTTSCIQLKPDGSADNNNSWAFVDLGYIANVAAVVVSAGKNTTGPGAARVYVTYSVDDRLTDAAACSADPLPLQPGEWAVTHCNKTGRFATLSVPLAKVDLCELQVYISQDPAETDKSGYLTASTGGDAGSGSGGGGTTGMQGGVIAGIVLAALLAVMVAVLLGTYLHWRRQRVQGQRQVAPAASTGQTGKQVPDLHAEQHIQQQQQTGPGGEGLPSGHPPAEPDLEAGTPFASAAAQTAAAGGEGSVHGGARTPADSSVHGGARTPADGSVHGGGGAVAASRSSSITATAMAGAAAAAAATARAEAVGIGGGGGDGIGGMAPIASGGRRGSAQLSEMALIKEFVKSLVPSRRSSLKAMSKSWQKGRIHSPTLSLQRSGDHSHHGPTHADTDLARLPQQGFSEVSASELKLVEPIGEGSFGEVWLAKYCGALVAVKVLTKVGSDITADAQRQLLLRRLWKEAELMSTLRHPNVCLFLASCTEPPSLVFEYCARSSLDAVLHAGLLQPTVAKQLTWVRLLSMALDAAKGMLYLHSRHPPIAHRDLKSANLLVDSQWRVKVADFSFSRTLDANTSASTVVMTNPRWLAPEILAGQPGQLSADVWAFGTVLWELCTWELPFDDLNTYQIIARVQSQGAAGLHVPPPDKLPAGPFAAYASYVALMRSCWAQDPDARPRFDTIVQQLGAALEAEQAAIASGSNISTPLPRAVRAPTTGPAYAAMMARMKSQAAVRQQGGGQQQQQQQQQQGQPGHGGHGGQQQQRQQQLGAAPAPAPVIANGSAGSHAPAPAVAAAGAVPAAGRPDSVQLPQSPFAQ